MTSTTSPPTDPGDNRNAKPLPPRQEPNGKLKCPGKHCAGILNKNTPDRCPNCLQPLEKPDDIR